MSEAIQVGGREKHSRQLWYQIQPGSTSTDQPVLARGLGCDFSKEMGTSRPYPSYATSTDIYFPMQNWLKITSSRSSVAVLPTTSPTAFTATRRSSATSSRLASALSASADPNAAVRARLRASSCRE